MPESRVAEDLGILSYFACSMLFRVLTYENQENDFRSELNVCNDCSDGN